MEEIPLEPVGGVRITTLIDNAIDVLMPDQGFIKRWGPVGTSAPIPVIPAEVADGGKTVDFLRAEHGYSALIEIEKAGRTHRVLFDAGVTPDGLIGNLDRLSISPETFEAIVLSHGHYDHTMGMDGLIRRLGRSNLPVLIHPEFWTRRRTVSPGGGAFELPLISRSALEDVGFDIVEDVRPSFLLDGSLLITGEVDRTTEFEKGMPIHQALRGGDWEPGPTDPGRSGRGAACAGQGTRGPDGLRSCGDREHRALRQEAHRDRRGVRGDRRVPPDGRVVRADRSPRPSRRSSPSRRRSWFPRIAPAGRPCTGWHPSFRTRSSRTA